MDPQNLDNQASSEIYAFDDPEEKFRSLLLNSKM